MRKDGKNSCRDTCLWFRARDHTALRRWEWVTFLFSVSAFITQALYRWEPVNASLKICCVLAAPLLVLLYPLLYAKRTRAAVWRWVMKRGLNSPSEILEPVGKPQLFKCRKSWFYKMLIWSASGTRKQHGSEREPQLWPHLFICTAGWRKECDKIRQEREMGWKSGINGPTCFGTPDISLLWSQNPFSGKNTK